MAKHKNYSNKDIMNWKFKYVPVSAEWSNHLGQISEGFRMFIEGPSGHGKTEYTLRLAKMLAQNYGKVNYNSTEQGRSASFQQAWIRNKMDEIDPGKIMLCSKDKKKFDPWMESLARPNSGRVIVLDSVDYMEIKFEQFKELELKFKHKNIIVVCWNEPMSDVSRKIKYMCDIKVDVKNYVATTRNRFGGNHPYTIWADWKRPSLTQPTLFDGNGKEVVNG